MADIFGTKHDNTSGQVHWQLEGVCYIISWTFLTSGLKLDRNFCIPLHFQVLQTEISKQNSSKRCQTID